MSPTNNETQSEGEPDVNLWKRKSGRGFNLKTFKLKNVIPSKQDGSLPQYCPPLFYEFIKRIANDDQSLISSNSLSLRWYYTYLNLKLEAIDPQLLRYVKTVTSGSQEESTIVALFPTIVDLIKTINHVSIATIARELKARDQLQYTKEEAHAVYQLLFILIGLITFFYEPILSPEKGLLQINVGDAENEKRKRRSLRRLIWSSEITIDKGSKLSLADLLRNLCGGKLPISYNAGPRVGTSGDILETTNLNYYTLSKVANIQIIWVDSLLQHLDFDRRSKRLKIFRFPSFCYLLCFGDLDKTYLDRFFHIALDDGLDGTPNFTPADFFHEVIASYRMIFGQTKESWTLFRSAYGRTPTRAQTENGHDSLLTRLCSASWSHEKIYDEMDAPDAKIVYSATVDYPFFGNKLLLLREHVLMEVPHDIFTLWRDRRDINRFWTLYAVLIFGAIGVVLGVIQVGLSTAQVVEAR